MVSDKEIASDSKTLFFLGNDIYDDSKYIECFTLVSRLESYKYRSKYYLKQRNISNEAGILKNVGVFYYHDSIDDGDLQYYTSNIDAGKIFSKRLVDAFGMKGLECIASIIRNDKCIEYTNSDLVDNKMYAEIKILESKGYVKSVLNDCKKRKPQRMIHYYRLTPKGDNQLKLPDKQGDKTLMLCSKNNGAAEYSLEELLRQGLLIDARNKEKEGLLEMESCIDKTYAPRYHYILSSAGEKILESKILNPKELECLNTLRYNSQKIIAVSIKDLERKGMLVRSLILERQNYLKRVNDSLTHDKLKVIKEHYVLTEKGHNIYARMHKAFSEKIPNIKNP